MVSGNGIFHLESDTSHTAAGGMLYQWQDNQWVLVGYHSKKLPEPVQNYGVTELELTGLLANIHGFEQKLRNNYFEVIVDHKAIDYMVKSKHVPTTTQLATLLLKLMDYTFDLKYLEGNKLKVSDALSRLYIEEKHKVNDVIPLNFLLHFADCQLLQNYQGVSGFAHYKHIKQKQEPTPRTRYPRKARTQDIQRYQAGKQQVANKKVNPKISKSEPLNKQITSKEPNRYHLDHMAPTEVIAQLPTENKLQLLASQVTDPLSLHQDQLQKQLVNTIREVPEQFFQDLKQVIPANDKLSIFRKHIPKRKRN